MNERKEVDNGVDDDDCGRNGDRNPPFVDVCHLTGGPPAKNGKDEDGGGGVWDVVVVDDNDKWK